jgi:uncharacterized protein
MTADPALFAVVDAESLPLERSDPPARVVAGAPQCAERVIVAGDVEIGVWEVTPGRFLSAKPDIGEVMHFIAGSGTLTHADGTVTEIRPGVTVSLQPGWSGEWDVVRTVRKIYTIYPGAEKPTGPTS